MTPAVVSAAAAGLCAATALADVLALPRPARRGRSGRASRPAPAVDVVRVKAVCAAGGALLGTVVAVALSGRLAVLALVCAPAAGFLAPDVVIARRVRARRAAMGAELPDVLDLLRVAVEAGLPTTRALTEIGRLGRGPLASELRRAATAMSLGVPRAAALEKLVARCPIDAAPVLAASILRADRHGAPLAPTLSALAVAARADRARATREAAARAAPQIQLVVALLLVPAVMLLVAAALVQALLPPG